MGAPSGGLPGRQCGLDPDGGPQGGAEVDRGDAEADGRFIRTAGEVHDAGLGLEHGVVPGQVAFGADGSRTR